MNIPQTSLEPFGYIGIPTLRLTSEGKNEFLAILYQTIKDSFETAIKRWDVIQRGRACGVELPWAHDLLALRTELHGGEDVHVKVTETGDGFYINISFCIPNSNTRYGDFMEYPNGHNAS